MQCVTAVDGHWLAELGPMFYSVKDALKSRGVSIAFFQASPPVVGESMGNRSPSDPAVTGNSDRQAQFPKGQGLATPNAICDAMQHRIV